MKFLVPVSVTLEAWSIFLKQGYVEPVFDILVQWSSIMTWLVSEQTLVRTLMWFEPGVTLNVT